MANSGRVEDKAARVFVPVEKLKPGWLVDCDVYAGTTRLLARGTTVTAGILISLKSRNITQVEVQPESELTEGALLELEGSSVLPEERRSLQMLLDNASQVYRQHNIRIAVEPQLLEEGTQLLGSLFRQIQHGRSYDVNVLRPLAGELVRQYTASPHKAVKLLDLTSVDEYTYRHSINVALLYLSIACNWSLSAAELEEQVTAALLHDLGKALVSPDALDKQGELTAYEWELMKKHTVWSMQLAGDAGLSPGAQCIVHHHHERLDGSGYPDGLLGYQIGHNARLAAICDVYDATTTTRSYKGKLDFSRAIDILVHGAGTLFDPGLIHQFIRQTGRYPVGTFVRLSSGEVAVVRHVNPESLWRPEVSRVLAAGGNRLAEPEQLDLAAHSEIYITGLVSNHEPAD